MSSNSDKIRDLYRQRARQYDFAVASYRVLGLRERRYRRDTVNALALRRGDTVVDLACGTGLNFELLQTAVKREGRIIGVDLTDAMLDVARRRVLTGGWDNVELVEANLAEYAFPSDIAGVLSTFAISLVPEFDEVIPRGAAALRAGGRMAILDLKKPDHWPDWMVQLTAWVNRPFGVSVESTERRPWESIQQSLKELVFREYYFGYLYLSVGEAPGG